MISYFLEKSINHITQKKSKQQNIFDDSFLALPANTLRILKCSPTSFQNVTISSKCAQHLRRMETSFLN